MTLEARIKPTGLSGVTGNYVRRVIDRASTYNWQMTVWRIIDATNYPGFTPPTGTASIAFWLAVVDAHGGVTWKPVLTNYTNYPIVSDHWYKVRVVWNTNKPGGTSGQTFVPADIFVDDQGTDGNGAGENWSGFANATNSSQSYQTSTRKLYTGDEIRTYDGRFIIGANNANPANNLFNGLIDWIKWDDVADYSGT